MGSLSVSDELSQYLKYPVVRRDESVVDNYHGTLVPDPYRWLEDPDCKETKEFVEAQVKVTESVLKTCDATRDKIRETMTEMFDHPRHSAPFKRGNKYFYFHNTGLQPQDVFYVQDGTVDGKADVLLDPNKLSDDGTVSLTACAAVSEDGRYFAYGLSKNGSDWVTIEVMRIEDRGKEGDALLWVKFSTIAWTNDSRGFFYSRYAAPPPNEGEERNHGFETNADVNHELYYHFLGTHQSEDILCWKDPDNPLHRFTSSVTQDGKYVILQVRESCKEANKVYYLDLSTFTLPNGGLQGGTIQQQQQEVLLPFTKLVDNFDASYFYVANDGPSFTFLTNKDAPRYKLIRFPRGVDRDSPPAEDSEPYVVVPESETDVLASAVAVDEDKLLLRYLSHVKYVVQVRDLNDGSLLHVLPVDVGTVCRMSARRKDRVTFFGFTSFLSPGIIYQCDFRKGGKVPELKIFREISVPKFDRSQLNVNQVFVPSKDGTCKIPIFIVSKNKIQLDGSHPCLLFGYGGFNVSLTPSFSLSRIILLKHLDVVFCVANIRGGGEYGEGWHRAGSLGNKQNCFDDFISVGEYLVTNGYTRPDKLCIEGASNGGLLVAACINQRPDLFGCALAHVGVMDMLRFHLFTIGHAWTSDFGCSDKEEEFHWLMKYSPLHSVRRPWEEPRYHHRPKCQYPSTMLLTADHDDRVVPSHSLKLLATLQYVLCTSLEGRSPQTNPIIGRIECKAGHGCGRPTQKLIDEAADRYGFMAKVLNASWID